MEKLDDCPHGGFLSDYLGVLNHETGQVDQSMWLCPNNRFSVFDVSYRRLKCFSKGSPVKRSLICAFHSLFRIQRIFIIVLSHISCSDFRNIHDSAFSYLIFFKESLFDNDTEEISRNDTDYFSFRIDYRESIVLARHQLVVNIFKCFYNLEGNNRSLHYFLCFKKLGSS